MVVDVASSPPMGRIEIKTEGDLQLHAEFVDDNDNWILTSQSNRPKTSHWILTDATVFLRGAS